MEGYYNFKPPCYNKTLENAKIHTCGHGSEWNILDYLFTEKYSNYGHESKLVVI